MGEAGMQVARMKWRLAVTEVSMKPELYSAHPMATDHLIPRPRVQLPTNGMVRPWTTTLEVESHTKSSYLQKKIIVT